MAIALHRSPPADWNAPTNGIAIGSCQLTNVRPATDAGAGRQISVAEFPRGTYVHEGVRRDARGGTMSIKRTLALLALIAYPVVGAVVFAIILAKTWSEIPENAAFGLIAPLVFLVIFFAHYFAVMAAIRNAGRND